MAEGPQHPLLIRRAAEVEQSIREYSQAVKYVRKSCKHDKVVQQNGGRYGADLGWHKERRICMTCGLEEEGHYGSYKKLNTEFLKTTALGSGEVYKYRPRWECK